jgi:RNA polymerase sigma-70 factor (ECF subfamily)
VNFAAAGPSKDGAYERSRRGVSAIVKKTGHQPGASAAEVSSDTPDEEVVARAQAGDHEAFRILVERYQGRAYGLALRILRDEEQARDAVQDAFIKVYGSLRRFEGRSSFYTWLYRLVYNQCLDNKRKDKSGRHVEWEEERLGEDHVLEETGPGAVRSGGLTGPGVELERAELRAVMAQAIDQLPDDARETLVLREIEGLPYAEIAETLGIPKGTVMSRLHYARKRVQQLLLEAGVSPPGAGGDSVIDGGDGP